MSDQLKDLRKLCILNAKETESDEAIRSFCEKFGVVLHFNRPPNNKRLAFPLFRNESDAAAAKDALIAEGYRVDFAKARSVETNGKAAGSHNREHNEFRSRHSLNGISENDTANCTEAEADSTGQPDNKPYGICIKCGDKARHNCGRCGDFYCSEECQSNDWLSHKRVCFPMPKLVPAKSTFSLSASRGNITDSTEAICSPENKNLVTEIDAPDGQQKILSSPRATNHYASTAMPVSPVTSCAVSTIEQPTEVEYPKAEAQNVETVKFPHPKSSKSEAVNDDAQSVRSGSIASFREKIILAQTASAIPRLKIPNDSEVFITYVRNNKTVYVRPATLSKEYAILITKVEIASKTARKLSSYPCRDEIVMAPFEGGYYRAMVINTDTLVGTVKVGFMDFGNAADVQFDSLKELPDDLKEHPRQTIMVTLKNITTDADENEMDGMQKHLEELCATEKVLKIKSDGPEIAARDLVELFDVISNQSINEAINGMVRKRYCFEDLDKKVIKDPGQLLMLINDEKLSENFITCILQKDIQEFMAGDDATQNYGKESKNAPAYKPKNKELCVIKLKEPEGEIWYRCLYQQELVDDMAQVFCIDYGRIVKANANDIRVLPSHLLHGVVSVMCYIENGDTVSKERKEKMLALNPQFTPKSIEFNGEYHSIKMDF